MPTDTEMHERVPERVRWRLTGTLFGGVALGGTAFLAAGTVAAIVAVQLTGSPSLAGLPSAVAIAGTALGAMLLSVVMRVRGRRPGLALGYALGALGAGVAGAGALRGSFAALLVGSALMGSGNSANQLARYAATDVHPEERRGRVLGWVLWAATIGAVAGPTLGTLVAEWVGALGGAYGVAVVAFALAAGSSLALLRPDPATLAGGSAPGVHPAAEAVGRPSVDGARVRVAVVGLATSQCVMVLLMTMAPVHLDQHGVAVAAVGWVMSSHVLGMYALTPLAGIMVDRLGAPRVLVIGLVVLAASGLAGAAAGGGALAMAGAMFLLGLGWSCGFVASSGMLAGGGSYAHRARLQGRSDTLVFATAAVASLVSGPLLGAIGYAGLCLVGSVLVLPAALVVGRGVIARRPGLESVAPSVR